MTDSGRLTGSRERSQSSLSSPVGFDPGRLEELAERCEEATGADRQLDYAIIKAVGYANDRPYSDEDAWRMPGHFTASLDAAMTLVPEGCGLHIHRFWAQDGERWACQVSYGLRGEHNDAEAVSAPLALCAAALRARAALTPPSEPTEK